MSIKTALGAFGVSMLAASAAMAGGLANSDNALNDYVSKIQGADQMSAKQMEETKGTLFGNPPGAPLGIGPTPPLPFGGGPFQDPYVAAEHSFNYEHNCFVYNCADKLNQPGSYPDSVRH
jgi:hypothetical protein